MTTSTEAHTAAARHRRRQMLVAALSPFALALGGCQQPAAPHFTSLDITGATYAQGFSLNDPDGRVRTLADFKGRLVLLFFGFTQCPDVCPTALSRAVAVRQLLGAAADRLQVIFVTIDPQRDTAALLKSYTTAFDPGFLGLCTDDDGTAAVARDFKVFYRKVPTGSSYTMDHTALSYVFDTRGHIRLVVRHEQTAEQLAQDLQSLLRETS